MIRIKGDGDPVFRATPAAISRLKDDIESITKKRKHPVTKSPKRANIITPRHTPEKGGDRRTGKGKAPNPPPALEQRGVGRPKVHPTAADRQRAYRERQKEKA